MKYLIPLSVIGLISLFLLGSCKKNEKTYTQREMIPYLVSSYTVGCANAFSTAYPDTTQIEKDNLAEACVIMAKQFQEYLNKSVK